MEVAASFSKWPRGPQLLPDAEATNRPKSPCKPRCFPTHRVLNLTIAPGTPTWHQRRHGFYSSLIWFSRGFPSTSSTALPPPPHFQAFLHRFENSTASCAWDATDFPAGRKNHLRMGNARGLLVSISISSDMLTSFAISKRIRKGFLVEFIGVLCLSHSIAKVDKSYLFDAVSSHAAMCIYSI